MIVSPPMGYNDEDTYIAAPSLFAVRLQMRFDGTELAVATGFITGAGAGPLLITARHNLTGRDQETGKCISDHGGTPNEVVIWHNGIEPFTFIDRVEPLYDDDVPRWVEHPTLGAKADFVALPLTQLEGVSFDHTVFPFMPLMFRLTPAEPVSVIGYPFGVTGAGDLGIWTTGFIATEIDLDYGDLPRFLIDARTRKGQSGSPVLAYRTGFTRMRRGEMVEQKLPAWDFLGIYSGRIRDDSDIGVVWKISAIAELIKAIAARKTEAADHQ